MSESATIVINGNEFSTQTGRLLIDVAEENDIFVPRFCYHPGLEPVAACRMCMVHIEGSRKPVEPACVTRVTDSMVVHTNNDAATAAQQEILELLLINHPLDCPICDRGGECPLQDQTLQYGPGGSRYQEPKRRFKKALPISKMVTLDRERCVLCWRCVRFNQEVSGDEFIDLMDRGAHTQINTAQDTPFDSNFSGNTIQICPVGALTSASYRFLSRPWDLETTATTCSYCSVGCPSSLEHREGELLRAQALPSNDVNRYWNCDKGRFGHRYVSNPARLHAPMIEGSEVSWDRALDLVATRLKETDPAAIGAIVGSHLTNEDVFVASKLFRDVVGTNNLDFRTFDSAYSYDLLAQKGVVRSNTTFDYLESASTILWVGPDPKEELPVLYLRIREALAAGVKCVVVHSRRISLCDAAIHIQPPPGFEAEAIAALMLPSVESGGSALSEARSLISEGNVVVCAGQQFVGVSHDRCLRSLSELIRAVPSSKLLLLIPNSNSQGCIDFGLTPWSGTQRGLSSKQMLEAAATGRLKFLWLIGVDLTSDFPDAALVRAALQSQTFIVTSEILPTKTAGASSVVLAAQSFAEKDGSFTNLEGRIQRVRSGLAPPGAARADWRIFADIAKRLGGDFGLSSVADIWESIRRESPSLAQLPSLDDPVFGENSGKPEIISGNEETGWPLSWELRAKDAAGRAGYLPSFEASSNNASGDSQDHARPSQEFPLLLLASRSLFDAGTMASHSPELRNLMTPAFVELHPDEASTRGLAGAADVVVSSAKGSLRLQLRMNPSAPRRAAHLIYDPPGSNASVLMDSSLTATYVEISA